MYILMILGPMNDKAFYRPRFHSVSFRDIYLILISLLGKCGMSRSFKRFSPTRVESLLRFLEAQNVCYVYKYGQWLSKCKRSCHG